METGALRYRYVSVRYSQSPLPSPFALWVQVQPASGNNNNNKNNTEQQATSTVGHAKCPAFPSLYRPPLLPCLCCNYTKIFQLFNTLPHTQNKKKIIKKNQNQKQTHTQKNNIKQQKCFLDTRKSGQRQKQFSAQFSISSSINNNNIIIIMGDRMKMFNK